MSKSIVAQDMLELCSRDTEESTDVKVYESNGAEIKNILIGTSESGNKYDFNEISLWKHTFTLKYRKRRIYMS